MLAQLKLWLIALLIAVGPAVQAETPNSLVGVFTEVPADSKFMGAQVTFTGLRSKQVTAVWPDGNDDKMTKLVATDDVVVLQFVSSFGGTDTAYLDLKNKRFLIVTVSTMLVPVAKDSIHLNSYSGSLR
jgi:hypothetical protein